jgi:low-density lipoprotein receptor class B
VFGRRLSHAGHSHHVGHPHPLRRRVLLTILVAALLAALALLISPPHAHGNFVYWTEASPNSSIGRGKINGTGQNNNFITSLSSPVGVAVDSKFIYWTDRGANQIGRANLDGSGVKRDFITGDVSNPAGIAIAPTGIYWVNNPGATSTIGHANIDGTSPEAGFITTSGTGVLGVCGLAADSNFVYWSDGAVFARSTLNGSSTDPNFVTGANFSCGPAVDPSFVYWATDGGNHVGRAPVGGGAADNSFIEAGTTSGGPSGVAVNSQYVFWGNFDTGAIGRANINGSSPNLALIRAAGVTGPLEPSLLAAAPSNKITVNSITKKKKKGTATINAKVPGPGQVTLNQTSTPPDANATAAAVKQQGLTITAASSFKLAVKPVGKTAKKLKKQLKRKRTAKVKVNVFIHFVPSGVAGVPNSHKVGVTLVKQRKK